MKRLNLIQRVRPSLLGKRRFDLHIRLSIYQFERTLVKIKDYFCYRLVKIFTEHYATNLDHLILETATKLFFVESRVNSEGYKYQKNMYFNDNNAEIEQLYTGNRMKYCKSTRLKFVGKKRKFQSEKPFHYWHIVAKSGEVRA